MSGEQTTHPSVRINTTTQDDGWLTVATQSVRSPLTSSAAEFLRATGRQGRTRYWNILVLSLRLVTKRAGDVPQDYLYQLVKAVKELSPASHDSHLEALEVSVFL